ncbi:DUF6671 family protein [Nocardiopsis metallicus]|uniref:DUF6671 domain-containing protein n=1 Tax=Nocardiopsis metallicus TaxID=179819 RepID=A0A840WK58_9ACTN|nr:DUF6671 family protein [Nocardiopsis metallicus]MBB5490478.1 hypothetical protein [Nocardiopsis metallicus]
MSGTHPYRGTPVALATKHAKEHVLAPALARAPGLRVSVPELDTDRLGTFTGEIERPAPARETALLKARLGIEASGLPRGLASEGSFGPHPQVPFVPVGLEILAFVDHDLGIEVVEQRLSEHTNFAHTTASALDQQTERFLASARFGEHALIVRPNAGDTNDGLQKGIVSREELAEAIRRCAHASEDGLAFVETDMRAHHNPTRMRQIALLARRLADRLSALCPACAAPGYGTVDTRPGLPCSACRTPTARIAVEVQGCARCEHRRPRPVAGARAADPGECPYCNP